MTDRLISSGQQGMDAAAQLARSAAPIEVISGAMGRVRLVPGTVFSENRLLVYASPLNVYYTVGDAFYEGNTAEFLQNEWLVAIGRGAQGAMPMVTLAQAEWDFIKGLIGPWYLNAALTAAQLALLYHDHRELFNNVISNTGPAMQALNDLRQSCPRIFNKLLRATSRIWSNLPSGITMGDIAFWIGRLIHGTVGLASRLPSAAPFVPSVTLRPLMRMAAQTTAFVGVLHSPSIVSHAAAYSARQLAADLGRDGIAWSEADSREFMDDLVSNRRCRDTLAQLGQRLTTLAPLLDQFQQVCQQCR